MNEITSIKFQIIYWCGNKTFGDIIPTANWAYPVVKGVKFPEAFSTLHRPEKMMLMDGKTVETQRKAVINEWLKAIQKQLFNISLIFCGV